MSNVEKCFSTIMGNCCKYRPNSRLLPETLFEIPSKIIKWMLGITEADTFLHRNLFLHAIWEERFDKKICHFSYVNNDTAQSSPLSNNCVLLLHLQQDNLQASWNLYAMTCFEVIGQEMWRSTFCGMSMVILCQC